MAEPKNPSKNISPSPYRNRKRSEDLSNYVFGKVQPQATPLEEAVIGALMLDKDALAIVVDILRPDSFYLEAHKAIFEAMLRLFERSQPIDLLTVMEELKKGGDLELAGGPAYLAELTNRVASAANIEYHARIISQKYIQRELITVSTKIIRDAFEDTTDVFQLLDDAEQGLFNIAQQNMSRGYDNMGSLASKALKQLEELKNKEDGLTGVPTGFTDLDRLTSGWQPSDLVIIAARPGMGKCLGKGTKVLMFDGLLKKVEDIQTGDLLMGDDSTPRKVLSLARGREKMYWVRQNYGIDYRVNESHILSLKTNEPGNAILDISIKDYLAKPPTFHNNCQGFKVAVNFPEKEVHLPPYFLGLWLSNKLIAKGEKSAADKEVLAFSAAYTEKLELHLKERLQNPQKYSLLNPAYESVTKQSYSLQRELEQLGVLDNKYIPDDYLLNSSINRLEVLAGLIDGNGYFVSKASVSGFEIAQGDQVLARQIKFLGDSLGFRTSFEKKNTSSQSTTANAEVFIVGVYGNLKAIPIRIKNQQAVGWNTSLAWQLSDIQIEYDQVDDYYGFEIDGNGRFLLEDMTVTHNTSFVLSLAKNAASTFNKGVAIFSLEMSSLQLAQRIISMEAEISGSKLRNGQLEDYEWQQLHTAIEKVSEAPIYIDDTPGINIFEIRAKCRRLKMQHDIQLVIIDYLQLMSGGGDNQKGNREQEVSAISRALKGLAKELSVPVIALSQLSRAVEVRGGTKRPQLSDLRESGCLTGDALIQDVLTGKLISIKELAARTHQGTIQVLAVDEDSKVGTHPMIKAFYSGRKQVFELKTKSGRAIKASANHPFLKSEGWTALENLKVSDQIAVPDYDQLQKPADLFTINDPLTSSGQEVITLNQNVETQRIVKNTKPLSKPDTRLHQVVNLDILWDEIIAILPLGVEDVYDATVAGVHNFVANDIFVHNSIEQDADIVSFIYRPEYYQILEDEEGQSLKGVAEIIIAKNRHGALKTVKLKFTDQFARFSNLDDPNFDDLPNDTFENPYSNIITRPSKMNDDEDIPF